MEAYILTQNGGIENLRKVTLPTPQPAYGEVLIKTKGIGINPIDSQVRSSKDILGMITQGNVPDTVILGWDVAGVIEQVGQGVEGFKAGDEVFGLINMPGLGKTYATYLTVSASQIALKPSKLSFTAAAATPMSALTAWQALVTLGQVQKGERVLIHGASGGVGHFAVQLAKYSGAYVIGTGSAKNESFIRGLGADEFLDYAAAPFEQKVKDLDLVIDTVNSVEHVLRSIKVIKTGGRLVYLQPHFQNEVAAHLKAAKVTGQGVFVHSSGKALNEIANLIEKGNLTPHVSTVLSFDQLPEAHRLLENGRATGKIAIMTSHNNEGLVKALTSEELNTIHSFYNIFNNRNFDTVDAVLADNWQDIPMAPGQADGAEGFKELVKNFSRDFPDINVTIHEIFGSHEKAGVRAEMSFTHSSEFMGIAPTNKRLTIALHDFHYLNDNKIVKTWHLEDWLTMLIQTGGPMNA